MDVKLQRLLTDDKWTNAINIFNNIKQKKSGDTLLVSKYYDYNYMKIIYHYLTYDQNNNVKYDQNYEIGDFNIKKQFTFSYF
jgi:type 1 glutamine amidotransferase